METKSKIEIIKQVGEEITTEKELKNLFDSNQQLIAYDGFEPSGRIHLPQGYLRAVNVNKVTSTGIKFKMLVANWHGYLNNKMGGSLEKINIVGEYFIEVWKASGMNLENVEFVWGHDVIKDSRYWELVMKMALKNNLPRVLRTIEIMGRKETDSLKASSVVYPLMQAADIFCLGANITQLGMDQRKVNMLAREVAEDLGFQKPVVVSHHMLQGLQPPEKSKANNDSKTRSIDIKMSKSKPDGSIFMTDTIEEVENKIKKAWCPEAIAVENPILDYCKHVVFASEDNMLIQRLNKFGGDKIYNNYQELENDYVNGNLYPLDLKNNLSRYINKYIEPVRNHFENNQNAKKLKEQVDSFKVTR